MYSNISGHTFIKNEERLGSEEGERGGGGGLLMKGEGGRKFMMIYWGGGQNFSISHHEKCITNLPLLL